MDLHKQIKKERKKRKITLMELVAKTGISYGMIYRLEAGTVNNPRPDVLRKVAEALEMSYRDMLIYYNYINEEDERKSRERFAGNIKDLLEEVNVINVTDLMDKKPKIISKANVLKKDDVHVIVQVQHNDWLPLCRKGSYIGLSKHTIYETNGLYMSQNKNKTVGLLVAKEISKDVHKLYTYIPQFMEFVPYSKKTPMYRVSYFTSEICYPE